MSVDISFIAKHMNTPCFQLVSLVQSYAGIKISMNYPVLFTQMKCDVIQNRKKFPKD